MNVSFSSPYSWDQCPSLFTKENISGCLHNVTSAITSPVTHYKIIGVAFMFFSLISGAEGNCRSNCYNNFDYCSSSIISSEFLTGGSCGDNLRWCLNKC